MRTSIRLLFCLALLASIGFADKAWSGPCACWQVCGGGVNCGLPCCVPGGQIECRDWDPLCRNPGGGTD
jgi:hypothetical protein